MSPGREAEATGMEAGAPRPASREMGKAGFSVGVGLGASGAGCARQLVAFHQEMQHDASCAWSCRVPSRDTRSGLPGSGGLDLVFVTHLFGFPEPKRCF